MIAALLGPDWLWHPLVGRGYQFWSGLGGDLGQVTLITGLVVVTAGWVRHHNCHVKGCWRLQWHPHPEHGHPVCRRHFPDEHLP